MPFSPRLSAAVIAAAAVVAASLGTTPASGEPGADRPPQVFMSEADMTASFGGKTITGQYADGVGFSETYGADGRIDYRERGRDMTGRWLVRAGTFCTLYDTSPTGGCYRVVRRGPNCFEFYFIARDETQAERRPGLPSWTAQAWIKDLPATCKDDATV
jgi:hypothetical protein